MQISALNCLGLHSYPPGSPGVERSSIPFPESRSPPFLALDSNHVPPHLHSDISFEKGSYSPPQHQEFSFSHYNADYDFDVRAPPPSEASTANSPHIFPISLPPSPEPRSQPAELCPTTIKAFSSLWNLPPPATFRFQNTPLPTTNPTPISSVSSFLFESSNPTPGFISWEEQLENSEGKRPWEASGLTSTPAESPSPKSR